MTDPPTAAEATDERARPGQPVERTPDTGGWTSAAAAVSVTLMAPVFIYLVRHPAFPVLGVHDFAFHLDMTDTVRLWPPHINMPQPVFHVLVRMLDPVLGRLASAVTVLLAAVAMMAVALVRIFSTPAHRRDAFAPATAAALTVAYFATESPNLVLQAVGLLPAQPFAPVHIWGNPTETIAVAPALLLLPAAVVLIDRLEAGSPVGGHGWVVAALTVVSALAKPSLVLVLVPAAVVHLATSRAWSRQTVWGVVGWLGVPAGAVLAWQAWLLGASGSSAYRTGFTWDPFALFEVYGWTRGGPAYWLPVLIPLSAAIVGGRRFWSERAVALTLWAMLLAMVPLLFMRETGERPYDGNLAKSGYYCWMLLWVLTMRFWALEVRDAWETRTERRSQIIVAVTATIGALALASGVLVLLSASGALTLPDSWGSSGV